MLKASNDALTVRSKKPCQKWYECAPACLQMPFERAKESCTGLWCGAVAEKYEQHNGTQLSVASRKNCVEARSGTVRKSSSTIIDGALKQIDFLPFTRLVVYRNFNLFEGPSNIYVNLERLP
jgi:hypothetical protein